MRRTSACSYSSTSARNASSCSAARGAYHVATYGGIAASGSRSFEAHERVPDLALEPEGLVALHLHAHQQRVERGDVDAGRVETALQRLDERRARAGERIEDAAAGTEVPPEQHLDELRDELPEIRVQAVDVPRPLPLRKLALRPRELEVDAGVKSVLRRCHALPRFDGGSAPPGPTKATSVEELPAPPHPRRAFRPTRPVRRRCSRAVPRASPSRRAPAAARARA